MARRPTPGIGCSPPTTPRSRRTSRPRSTRRHPSAVATAPTRTKPARSSSSTSAASSPSSSRVACASSTSTRSCCRTTRRMPSSSGAARAAIILSGGPNSVYDEGAPRPDAGRLERADPGARDLLRRAAHGPRARRRRPPATAASTARPTSDHARTTALFDGIERDQPVWMSHGDSITRLPEGFRATAQTDSTPFAGLADPGRNLYGIQFHPEVVHTPRGRDVLRNFVVGIAGRRADLDRGQLHRHDRRRHPRAGRRATPRETGSDGRVICALSGGVDSAVAAALVHRAVGDRLTCIYVDHGLMRKKESELLRVTFERDLGMNLVMVDARDALPRPAGRRRGSRAEAQDHRRRVHPGLRGGGREARPDRLPDPGHALPGRHRERDLGDEGRPEDQDPPQRRRAAGRPAVPAHRAAALPVQGRGAQGRPRAGPARGDGPAPAVPGPGAGDPDHRRGHGASGSTRCARPTGSSSTRSRRAGLYR